MSENLIGSGWNIIEEEEFKNKIIEVFSKVSTALARTLGPNGTTTIIERHGNFHVTKDGWTVLKNLKTANPIDNNIMQMIVDIAAQVAVRVGDGTTTSIVAANNLLQEFNVLRQHTRMKPKKFINLLNKAVTDLVSVLTSNATPIDKEEETDFSKIYDLAYISTNGDEEISSIIQTIYKETRNPSIYYTTSKTNRTSYEVVKGYKMQFMTFLDGIFMTNDRGTCEVDNPVLLMLDYKFEYTPVNNKILAFAKMFADEQKRKLVVVAPFYDSYALNSIKQAVMHELNRKGEITTIYTRVSNINKLHDTIYNDFSILTGGSLLRESDVNDDDMDDAKLSEIVKTSLGTVGQIVIEKNASTITGLDNKNETYYKIAMDDAKSNYTDSLEKDSKRNIISTDTFEAKRRLSMLGCKMGTIYIGGTSELAKESNKDLVEDAVKACESAFNYGYNKGCNVSIIEACDRVMETIDVTDVDLFNIISCIKKAFSNIMIKLITEGIDPDSKNGLSSDDIIKKCITDYVCFDLNRDDFDYDNNIINPCHTDIEILKATTSIISLIINSNQYLSIIIKEDA